MRSWEAKVPLSNVELNREKKLDRSWHVLLGSHKILSNLEMHLKVKIKLFFAHMPSALGVKRAFGNMLST